MHFVAEDLVSKFYSTSISFKYRNVR